MSSLKSLVLGILVWGAVAAGARADVLTWPNSTPYNWAVFVAASSGTSSSNSISFNNYWAAIPTPASPPASAVPTTTIAQTTVISNAPATMASPFSAAAVSSAHSSSSSPRVDGFVNMGNGPYPNAALITTGGAQPWYNSSQINSFFGGQPTAQQQQSFDSTVLSRVQQTFAQSGVPITLTSDPNVAAHHTISLVSNTGSASLSSAIGMSQVGTNGFSFIDQITKSAQSLDQLEWIVAHNISHELMLALGVPENYDATGKYVDSKLADWAMMVNPNATFSPGASQALLQAIQNETNNPGYLGAQALNPSLTPAPEPATWAIWRLRPRRRWSHDASEADELRPDQTEIAIGNAATGENNRSDGNDELVQVDPCPRFNLKAHSNPLGISPRRSSNWSRVCATAARTRL